MMKATIVKSSFGLLAFDGENRLIEKMFFSKKPQTAAQTLGNIEAGKATDEYVKLVRLLEQKGYDTFVVETASLAKELHEQTGADVDVGLAAAPIDVGGLAVQLGFVKDADEFKLWTHNLTMEIAKQKVKHEVEKRDLVVAQAIQTLDELDRTINMLMARVREWYGIHFPELDRMLDKHETYARLVTELGDKANFTAEKLAEKDLPTTKAEAIAKVAEKSMGADLQEADLKQIQALCEDVLGLYRLRERMGKYLDLTMEEVAPNTKILAGSLLGARLIAIAGGLMNLAKKPASTIQVLGAEKALFRSLKSGTRPPKHGLIFQHALLHDAKRWQRGKIARALAGKLAIAARADAFGGRDISKELKQSLERRTEESLRKYEQPPLPSATPKPPRQRDQQSRRKHRRER